MKRYLVTNPNFVGSVELIYSPNGMLKKIDFENCIMSEIQVHYFKEKVPSNLNTETVADVFSKETVVIMVAIDITFEMFWDAYKKKINLKRARPLWDKLSAAEQVQAFLGVALYDKYLKKESWRSKADPETYLRNKYYENEYETKK